MLKISVVITAYNEEQYLPTCLQSVFSSDFPKDEFEVVVVNNNSKDSSAEIAKKFGARVLNEEKQGYVYALSHGMNEALGEIIAVTDADTVVSKNWLSEIEKSFIDKNVIAVTGMSDLKSLNFFSKLVSGFGFYTFVKFNFLIGKPHLSGFNFAVRRQPFVKAGGLNTNYQMSPDVELGLRMKKFGKIIFNKQMVAHTSMRRWKEGYLSTANMYIKGYIYTAWLHRSPPVRQKPVR